MGKVMDYEKQVSAASSLPSGGLTRGEARIARRGEKAAAKLAKFDDNLINLGIPTDAPFMTTAINNASAGMSSSRAAGFRSTLLSDVDFLNDTKSSIAGMGRTRALSQTIKGFVPQGLFETTATLGGRGSEMLGTKGFDKVANTFAKAMEGSRFGGAGAAALDDLGHVSSLLSNGYGRAAEELLTSNSARAIRSTAVRLGADAFARREFGTAAKMAGQNAGTLGPMASKAFGAFGTASMVYDIGKGVGKTIMGGVNLGKDALKSMQGSLNKPLFGAGFKDNEVAATSRSRGVMAIQNSRLNARSSLGSEGDMMAAHFG
jgi:hypothetical protein